RLALGSMNDLPKNRARHARSLARESILPVLARGGRMTYGVRRRIGDTPMSPLAPWPTRRSRGLPRRTATRRGARMHAYEHREDHWEQLTARVARGERQAVHQFRS